MTQSRPEWFADVPAWSPTGGSPAYELAQALAAARLATGASAVDDPVSPDDQVTDKMPSSAPVRQPRNEEQRQQDFAREQQPDSPRPPNTEFPSAFGPQGDQEKPRAESLDDSLFENMRVRPTAKKDEAGPTKFWKNHRGPIIGAAAAVIVIAVAAGITVSQLGGDDSESSTDAVGPTSTTSTSTTPAETCESIVDGAVTTGDGPGDQASGPGVILAFNHAYYVDRSAKAARAVAAPNAVATQPVMQKYIDQREPGTKHCLSITDRGNNTYSVVLTEIPPDPSADPIVYRQTIRTVESRGKTWIASIKADE
ncbi:hypothetical protein AAFP35_04250 [Gordonia sp. CPCC 206044]